MNSLLELAKEIGKLCAEKNAAYGDSHAQSGKILEILFPAGVRVDQYTDMLGVVRVLDKLFRIATQPDAFGESPWRDIAGYGLLGAYNAAGPAAGSGSIGEFTPRADSRSHCYTCAYSDIGTDDMPCKKCLLVPHLMPHWRKNGIIKKGPPAGSPF